MAARPAISDAAARAVVSTAPATGHLPEELGPVAVALDRPS